MADKTCLVTVEPLSRAIQHVVVSIAAYPFGESGAGGDYMPVNAGAEPVDPLVVPGGRCGKAALL